MNRKQVLLAAVSLITADIAWAVNHSYTGASGGTWSVASNWTPAVVPPGGIDLEEVNVNLPAGGTVNFTSASDYSAARLYWLRTYSTSSLTTNTLAQSGGTLRTRFENVGLGFGGNGRFVQSGGTHIVDETIYLASPLSGVAGTGIYQMDGGTLSAGTLLVLGNSGGVGTFNHTSGFVSMLAGGVLSLGNNATSTGYYNLAGGTFSSVFENIGAGGVGTFVQTGGTHLSTSQVIGLNSGALASYSLSGGSDRLNRMYIGFNSGAVGTLSLSNNASLTINNLVAGTVEMSVGQSGAGTFLQTGGVGTLGGTLYLGNNNGSTGRYDLSGGSMTVGQFLILANNAGSAGTVNLSSAGSLNVLSDADIGRNGTATWNQTGGAASFGGTLRIAEFATSRGTAIISGGTLSTVRLNLAESVGAVATMTLGNGASQSVLNVSTLIIGGGSLASGGTATLNVGTNGTVNADAIGQWNGSRINLNGGQINAAFYAASNALPTPRLNWTAGTLNLAGLEVRDSLAVLNDSTLLAQTMTIAPDPSQSAFFQVAGSGRVNTNFLSIGVGTNSSGDVRIYNGGSLTDSGDLIVGAYSDGTLSVFSGGSLTVGGNTIIGHLNRSSGLTTHSSGVGTLIVQGAGSSFRNDGTMVLGFQTSFTSSAKGILLVKDGGVVRTGTINMTGSQNATSTLSVSGNGASVLANNAIYAGGSLGGASGGAATIDIGPGGILSTYYYVGYPNSTITLAGGTLSTGGFTNQGNFNWLSGTFSNFNWQVIGTGSLAIGPYIDLTSNKQLRIGVLEINPGAQVTLDGGTLFYGSLINNGSLLFNSGTIETGNLDSGLLGLNVNIGPSSAISAGSDFNIITSVNLDGGTISAGTVTVDRTIGGSFNFKSGTLSVNNFTTLAIAPGMLLGPSLQLTSDKTLAFTNGTLDISAGGALTFAGGSLSTRAINNTGLITGSGSASGNLTNSGRVEAYPNAILAFDGTAHANNAAISLLGGSVRFGGSFTNNAGATAGGIGNLVVTNTLTNAGTLNLRGTLQAAGISNTGTMQFSAGFSDVYGPVTNSKRITITGGSTTTFYDPVNTSAGSITVNNNSTVVFLGALTGQSKVNLIGNGTMDIESSFSGGPIAASLGSVIIGPDSVGAADSIRANRLSIYGNATIPSGAAAPSRIGTLTIDGGTFDLTSNDLILDSTPLASVASDLSSRELISSIAPAALGLGYATASSIGVNSFDGESVDGSDVLIRYTYLGDTNLDGKVNAMDFNAVATNFGSGPGKFWVEGDFNYDGTTNTADFTQLAMNFNKHLPLSGALAVLVPEPIGICGLFVTSALLRRRAHVR